MYKMKLAVQLYTLREFLQTPEDIRETFQKVKAIGYDAVQVSGVGMVDEEKAAVIKQAAKDNDLAICATHVSFKELQENLDWVIEFHKQWGCSYVGVGSMPAEYRDKEGYSRFAKEASEIGRKLKEHGLYFIYHNHSFEFEKFEGKTGMDILFEESDPESFYFELDTYWVQAGGANPVDWINKVKGRMQVVHFKDMGVDKEHKPMITEVGEGNLNWPAIIQACEDTNVIWAAVEQDVCLRDPFESVEMSLRYLQGQGF
ncbi:MAG: sugar phosphate isomerase/epimerase [Epulopiscium sp.]|nr:sugar phosphate isomerase/epimerase [Candidatus Epulonipiscium sp.]